MKFNSIVRFFSTKKTIIEKKVLPKCDKYKKGKKCKNGNEKENNQIDKTRIFIPGPESSLPQPWQKEIF
jgi:hypothetical protein